MKPPIPALADHEDPLRQLVPLRRSLQHGVPPQLVGGMEAQLESVETAVLSLLMTASAPLPAPLRILAQSLGELYALWDRTVTAGNKHPAGLGLLKQFMLALVTHTSPAPTLWPQAVALAADSAAGRTILQAMLAMTLTHPESQSPRFLWFMKDILLQEAHLVSLRQTAPDQPEGWHWLDQQGNFSSTSFKFHRSSSSEQLLFFHCGPLADRIEALLLEFDQNPEHPLLKSAPLPLSEIRSLMQRAADQWHNPASRRFNRRRQDNRATLCTRLDQLWSALGKTDDSTPETSEWIIINESAGGYALMHVSGTTTGLLAGNALGLTLPGRPWSLCLIRWIRSETSVHVEVGVELLSPQAIPVRMTLPNREPQPAFLMPTMPGLAREESLLAPREEWGEENNFVLLTEKDSRLRITSCLRGTPRHQTSGIEVFEFQRIGNNDYPPPLMPNEAVEKVCSWPHSAVNQME